MRVGATLGMSDRWQNPRECCQCRVRTWLQLMCCALVLELGVLISEQVEKVGAEQSVTGQSVTERSVTERKAES